MSISETIRAWLNQPILEQLKKTQEAIMAKIEDVQAGLDQLDTDTKALVDEQTKAFTDLEAAVKAGSTGPDLQPIVDRLTANHAALAQALVDAQTADAATAPPTPAA